MKAWTFPRSLLTITLLIPVIAIWKILFINGFVYGIYWLFVGFDIAMILLPAVTLLALFGFVIAWIHQWVRGIGRYRLFRKITLIFALQLLLIILIFPIQFAWLTIHLNQTRVEGNTFYLAAYPMFDVDFGLYRCDYTGTICRSVFKSGDYMDGTGTTLVYDPNARTLSVKLKREGVIYVYSLAQ